ncbi:MAG: hypothetical protein ABI904_04095 [Chloroflexota bacterium]
MKTFRILVGILAIFPLALLVDHIFLNGYFVEASLGEWLYLALGVPILTLNFWAWSYPEIIEFYVFGKEGNN